LDEAAQVEPCNRLEQLILEGRAGRADQFVVADAVWNTPIAVSSATPAKGFEDLAPVLFDRDGTPMVAAFSDPSRIGEVGEKAGYFLLMTGGELFRRLRPEFGVVLNPRTFELGMEFLPTSIADYIRRLG
jgi:hypothetical protein